MPSFTFKKIDIPGGPGSDGFVYISVDGVDAAGVAAGNFGDTNGDWHGFTVAPNSPFTQYDPPSSSNNTTVVGITPTGEIFGSYVDWTNKEHGFIYSGGMTTTINCPFANSTSVDGVTTSGELFGSYVDFDNTVKAYVDNNGTFTTIADPAGIGTSIAGINAAGVIVGGFVDSQYVAHTFIEYGGTFTTLNFSSAYSLNAVGITDSGEVVGSYQTITNEQYGFTYNNGVFATIDPAASSEVIVSYVSGAGEIVGYYVDGSSNVHGFIDENGTISTVDVPGATETQILGINAAGEIYGDYNDSSGQHGFVGIPGPIDEVYQAVLQRAPSDAELNAASSQDTASMIAGVVDSPEAQLNIYPVVQIIDLATLNKGQFPTAHQLAGWVPFIESNGLLQSSAQTNPLLDQMATAFVASDNFGKVYNNGADVDPNSTITAQELQVIIQQATGVAATPTQINAWVATGLSVDQVFVEFALGDQYTAASHTGIQQYLTEAADTAAGIQTTGISASAAMHA